MNAKTLKERISFYNAMTPAQQEGYEEIPLITQREAEQEIQKLTEKIQHYENLDVVKEMVAFNKRLVDDNEKIEAKVAGALQILKEAPTVQYQMSKSKDGISFVYPTIEMWIEWFDRLRLALENPSFNINGKDEKKCEKVE